MYEELMALNRRIEACRANASVNWIIPCHYVLENHCHPKIQIPCLIQPGPEELADEIDILTVGISPNWGASEETGLAEFEKVRKLLPAGSTTAHLNFIPCCIPDENMFRQLVNRCRSKFFNSAVPIIKPKMMIAIGEYVSERLYWHNCAAGQVGVKWEGFPARHATTEQVVFKTHKCPVIFIKQPEVWDSIEDTNVIRDLIENTYKIVKK